MFWLWLTVVVLGLWIVYEIRRMTGAIAGLAVILAKETHYVRQIRNEVTDRNMDLDDVLPD